jgi:microcystin-dependent protein
MFGGSTAPNSEWLICDGSAVSRTTYATLYGIIGTTFGVGNGSTTFNLPDMRSRMPIGVGTGTGLSARTLAQTNGAETHTIASGNLPTHTHNLNSHYHTTYIDPPGTWSGTVSSDHAHALPRSSISAAGTNRLNVSNAPTDASLATYGINANHQHYTDIGAFNADSGGPSNNSTSDGGFANSAISIMNPFLALNFIIKV